LAVHAQESDFNVYAYVYAQALRATDPEGLDAVGTARARMDFLARLKEHASNAAAAVEKQAAAVNSAYRTFVDNVVGDRAAYERSKAQGFEGPGAQPFDSVNNMIVQQTPAASGALFTIFSASLNLGPPGSTGAPVRIEAEAPSVPSAVPTLRRILGRTYDRLIEAGKQPKGIEKVLSVQATVVITGVDASGTVRTVIATANKEVWKDLRSMPLSAGEELLPFVDRTGRADLPHPDVVAAQRAQALGIREANVASRPRTCEGCMSEIPSAIPAPVFETPKVRQ
jgi:hypothetical protein